MTVRKFLTASVAGCALAFMTGGWASATESPAQGAFDGIDLHLKSSQQGVNAVSTSIDELKAQSDLLVASIKSALEKGVATPAEMAKLNSLLRVAIQLQQGIADVAASPQPDPNQVAFLTDELKSIQGQVDKVQTALLSRCVGVPALQTYSAWPRIASKILRDASIEVKARNILASLTLEEKVGQMTQPEIQKISPDDIQRFHIGTILNGGGSWPSANKRSTPQDWLRLADSFWEKSKLGNSANIPLIWGIDSVHGNSNVFGATQFPHNVGLGAARNPCLVSEIQTATAIQMRVTGQDWAFAPTLAVVRDDRWGRTYEGYSEDPRIVKAYGESTVLGFQGATKTVNILATAKHFIGDGGTQYGIDQGVNPSTEAEMMNIHGQGYYGALAAGVQTVMVSFNSWTNTEAGINEGKLHGSTKALTEILKGKLGFDGFVIGDWNGHAQVPGCSASSCAQAINAGVDMIMVPDDWRAFITNTLAQARDGRIPMSRIDDAVLRILRVKLRAGLLELPKPSARQYAGQASSLQFADLGRRAVRESLVLLKNNGKVLPLAPTSKVLVVGKSADSISNQTGGWTLTWQGTGNTNADFPNATSILAGLRQALGTENVTFDQTGQTADPANFDAVIAVIGETPYAEFSGDIDNLNPGSLELPRSNAANDDLAVLNRVSGKGKPVVTILLSGRPLYVNRELNRSDAFVAAWLPGTEGGGIADLLVKSRYTFTGKLSFSWPAAPCQTPLNVGDASYAPLFAFGYGLQAQDQVTVPALPEQTIVSCRNPDIANQPLNVFVARDIDPYNGFIGSSENWNLLLNDDPSATTSLSAIEARISDVNAQQDARDIIWKGTEAAIFYFEGPQRNLTNYRNADGALVFDTKITQAPTGQVNIATDCGYPCTSVVTVTNIFRQRADGTKKVIKIPLACFGNLDFTRVNVPLNVNTSGQMKAAFANVRWVPGAANDADAIACADLN